MIRETSLEAYDSIKPVAKTIRERIFALVANSPQGKTQDEIVRCGYLSQTVNPRINELVKAERVYDSGERRLTRSGRKATVWKAA